MKHSGIDVNKEEFSTWNEKLQKQTFSLANLFFSGNLTGEKLLFQT